MDATLFFLPLSGKIEKRTMFSLDSGWLGNRENVITYERVTVRIQFHSIIILVRSKGYRQFVATMLDGLPADSLRLLGLENSSPSSPVPLRS